jgi:hypothetical protein
MDRKLIDKVYVFLLAKEYLRDDFNKLVGHIHAMELGFTQEISPNSMKNYMAMYKLDEYYSKLAKKELSSFEHILRARKIIKKRYKI